MSRALLTVILFLSSCATPQLTITQAQAVARVDQLVHETATALDPRPRLELIPYSVPPGTCPEGEGQVIVNRKYWLRGVPESRNTNISRQVRAFWVSQGHHVTGSGTGGSPNLSGESQPDGFILALVRAADGALYLAATSTCVWPDGTPPETEKTPAH
ncbi:hypothetical protein [Nonomuraea longicatena]|uniref:Lipoprotein n=1 Tax=Nonomuraea longicatena TaxID=83682 RepID=A0ABP3ZN52_9ACTN